MTPAAGPAPAPATPPRIRLALVAEAPMVLAGLRASLAGRLDCEVVASATSLDALADLQRRQSGRVGPAGGPEGGPDAGPTIDVAVIDTAGSAAGALRRLATLLGGGQPGAPRACVLLADLQDVAAAGWLRDGISVLPRAATEAQIVAAAQAAASGLVAVAPQWLSGRSMLLPRSADADGALVEPLSPRERQVLARMADGLGNRDIARVLAISEHTAKFHVAQILGKLQAASRTEAVVKGLRYGLLDGIDDGAAAPDPRPRALA